MYRLTEFEMCSLRVIDDKPHHHLDLGPEHRAAIRRLWTNGLVRLRSFDVWEISPRGRWLLDAGGIIH